MTYTITFNDNDVTSVYEIILDLTKTKVRLQYGLRGVATRRNNRFTEFDLQFDLQPIEHNGIVFDELNVVLRSVMLDNNTGRFFKCEPQITNYKTVKMSNQERDQFFRTLEADIKKHIILEGRQIE